MEEGSRAPVPWLPIGRSVGRVAAGLLIASNFVYLLAPLFYLTSALWGRGRPLDFTDPSAALQLLLADSRWILAIGDGLVAVGAALLALAVLGLTMAFRPRDVAPRDALLALVAALACLVGWAVAAALALGRPRGTGLEAAAAVGGGSVAAALLLAASILYVLTVTRLRRRAVRIPPAPVLWVVYAVANGIGSAAIAGVFVGGSRDPDAQTFGLALQIILIPLVGVAAYKDLWDHVGDWRQRTAPAPAEHVPLAVVVDGPAASDGALADAEAPPPPPPE